MVQLFVAGENVDVKRRPYIDLLGSVTECNTQKHTFKIEPNQYIAFMHNATPFKAHVCTTDSKRWGDKKPKPPIGTNVLVGGYLEEIKRNNVHEVTEYEVDLDDITYVSAQSGGGKAGTGS